MEIRYRFSGCQGAGEDRAWKRGIYLLDCVWRWMKASSTASPFPRRLSWGRVTQKTFAAGTTLFVHVWDWPSDGQLLLPTVKEVSASGKLLANAAAVQMKNTPKGLP